MANSTEAHPRPGMRIVIAGGGTGGHLFPGIAVAEVFRRKSPDSRVLFITTGRPIEKRVLGRTDYECLRISAAGFKGIGMGGKLKALFKLPAGLLVCLWFFARFRPDVVIGMGAYSAAPVLVAARVLRIFRVIHEQNRIPGMTNRFLARFANRIYTSFPETEMGGYPEKIQYTGNPVRRQILEGLALERDRARGEKFVVLVLGGSQGAHAINTAVIQALEDLDDARGIRFIHQSGAPDLETVRQGYAKAGVEAVVEPFFDDMAACYAAADLVICRAGATSVAEVAAAGLAAVFIPYPHAADNHQYFNAKSLVDAGAAEMISQAEASGPVLAERIKAYAADEAALRQKQAAVRKFSRPEAAEALVDDICRALCRKGRGNKKG